MGGRAWEGPPLVGRTLDWNEELGRWLKPFVDRLGHRAWRRMGPLCVSGLIGPGDRKSVQPMGRSGLCSANMINCTTSLPPGSGRHLRVISRLRRLMRAVRSILCLRQFAFPHNTLMFFV